MDVLLETDMNIYVNNKIADRETKVYENFSVVWTMEELRLRDVTEKSEGEENDDFYFDGEDENDSGAQENVQPEVTGPISILVNGRPIALTGKDQFVFVDIFDFIDIDLSKPQGAGIVTNINGRPAQYMERLQAGDVIEVYWRK